MVGIFSRFSVGRSSHRRTRSAIDDKEVLAPNSDVTASTTIRDTHGIEVATEFKPVGHPCPFPEPSILNDGRIWKERVSASMRRRGDLQIMKDENSTESDGSAPKPLHPPNRSILPSLSAPEHKLLNLLE
ncbi:hypothetical protein Bca52824_032856 [Brassica carinata]|uniref:Uncharacterized protein n=1 Tax=Brassica carinata TaxID=52824 RepID=A0A8X7SCT9_BRACI|nr:hypothetical protein Bca52824_032856 [Brassica carinata]